MQRYSFLALARNALSGHRRWQPAWRSPELRGHYDVVIIGGGGHGLATAYYLARNHGITNVAVLERAHIGGGNSGRNTSVIRSNYLRDDSIRFFDQSVKLYETLARDLNFNIMFSQRSQVDVIQTHAKLRDLRRRMMAMDLHGADYKIISAEEVRRRIPILQGGGPGSRLPIVGGAVQERAGIARHDAIVWGLARGADARGVEIHQQTEVTGIERAPGGGIVAVQTNRGRIRAGKLAVCVSGHTTQIADMVGLRLPITTYNLQAWVSEPVKPILNVVANCPDAGVYVSQSDKGELIIGGATDPQQSFRQGSKQSVFETATAAMLELFPIFRRLKLLRQWGGALDFAHDASPIISKTPIAGLYVSCGWWGGFKAIPAGGMTFAHTIARDEPHPLNAPYGLGRFDRLAFLLEAGTVSGR